MTRGLAVCLETKLLVAESPAYLGIGRLGIEVGIAVFQELVNLWQTPPSSLASLWLTEGLADHLHKVVEPLIRLVLLNQSCYFVIIQPESLTIIKQVQGLGEELAMIKIVFEIDVLAALNLDTDETSRTCGVDKWLLLVGGADE